MLVGETIPLETYTTVPSIAPGETETLELSWTPPITIPPDTYRVYGEIVWEPDINLDNNITEEIIITIDPVSEEDDHIFPLKTELIGNYPNPFNPETTIIFSLATDSFVSIEIYNNKGQKVRTLVNSNLKADKHTIVWNGRDDSGRNVSSGIYFYKMHTDEYIAVRRMILMK